VATRLYDVYYRYATRRDLKRHVDQIEGQWHSLHERVDELDQETRQMGQEVLQLRGRQYKFEQNLAELETSLPGLESRLDPLEEQATKLHELAKNFALQTRLVLDLEPLLVDVVQKGLTISDGGKASRGARGSKRVFAQFAALRAWHREHADGEGDWNELLENLSQLAGQIRDTIRSKN